MHDSFKRQQVHRDEALTRFREFEAMTRAEMVEHQVRELNEQLDHTLTKSPFYRARAAHYPSKLTRLDELAAAPFTTKEELRDAYPKGFFAAEQSEIIRYGESTGTTGRPTSSAITYRDWILGNIAVERALGHLFGPGDLVFVSIPYELTFASYDIDRALEANGAAVASTGALSTVCPFNRIADMLYEVHPTGLVCTPSRALRLYDMIRDSGRDPDEVGLKTFLYVGETCSEAKLSKVKELWGVRLATAYGSTETNSLGLQCPEGGLHLTEDRYIFEVVDPRSLLPVSPGTAGELVLTSIATQAMPLIRYRTGDEVTISAEPCECGSPRRLIQHHGRVSEQYVIGHKRLNKIAVEQEILSAPGTGLYYAAGVLGDGLEVHVEVTPGAAQDEVLKAVSESVARAFGVRCTTFEVTRNTVMAAMDRMLKPGSLSLEDLRSLP